MSPSTDLAPPPLPATFALVAQETAPAGGGEGAPAAPSPWSSLLFPMLLVFAIFYFVMIGPERKNRRRREEMLGTLKKGDKVLTTGGMYAAVAAIQDDVVTLQIDDGVRARFNRSAIQVVLDGEGTAAAKAGGKKAS